MNSFWSCHNIFTSWRRNFGGKYNENKQHNDTDNDTDNDSGKLRKFHEKMWTKYLVTFLDNFAVNLMRFLFIFDCALPKNIRKTFLFRMINSNGQTKLWKWFLQKCSHHWHWDGIILQFGESQKYKNKIKERDETNNKKQMNNLNREKM